MSEREITPEPTSSNGPIEAAPVPKPSAGPKVALALGLAVLVAGVGVVVALRSSAGGVLDDHVPADAVLFARVALRLPSEQRAGLDALMARLPDEQRTMVTEGVDGALDEVFSGAGLSWSGDIKGWIGQEIGLAIGEFGPEAFVSGPPVVVLLSVRNEGAARDSLSAALATSSEAFVVQDGIAYISARRSTIDAFIDDAEGRSLVDNEEYVAARDEFGDGMAFLWADARDLIPALGAITGGAAGPTPPAGAFALGLYAEPNALVVEGRTIGAEAAEGGSADPIVDGTTAGQLGSLSLFDIGAGIEGLATVRDQAAAFGEGLDLGAVFDPLDALGLDLVDDLAAWLHGESTMVVAGLSGALPDVGLVVEVTDEDALDRTLEALSDRANALGDAIDVPLRARALDGQLTFEVEDFGLFTRRGNGRFAIATRPLLAEELLGSADAPLGEDPLYQRAVGAGGGNLTFQTFVRLDVIGALVTSFLPADERASLDAVAGALVSDLEAFIIRVTNGADGSTFRMALTLSE